MPHALPTHRTAPAQQLQSLARLPFRIGSAPFVPSSGASSHRLIAPLPMSRSPRRAPPVPPLAAPLFPQVPLPPEHQSHRPRPRPGAAAGGPWPTPPGSASSLPNRSALHRHCWLVCLSVCLVSPSAVRLLHNHVPPAASISRARGSSMREEDVLSSWARTPAIEATG